MTLLCLKAAKEVANLNQPLQHVLASLLLVAAVGLLM